MINLLPPEEKNKLLSEEKKKLAIIFWILFLFFIFCFILILLSIKFYLQGQVGQQKIIFQEIERRIQQPEIQNLQKKFSTFNTNLTKLNSFYKQKFYFSEILEKISKILPKETYLTYISATFSAPVEKSTGEESIGEESIGPKNTEKETPYVKVSLSGFIPTRESLFEFKNILEKEENIKEVSFPPANWVNRVNINFFVSFKILR